MQNITVTDPLSGKITEWVTLGNEEIGFTSMLKETYEEQQVQVSQSSIS